MEMTMLKNVMTQEGRHVDVFLTSGRIHSIEPSNGSDAWKSDQEVEHIIDGQGGLVLPAFVEPHIHLDTVLTAGEPDWNRSGTLLEGIRLWGERKKQLTPEDVRQRANEVMCLLVGHGVLYIRTHADISDPRMTALKTLLALKEEWASVVQLQVIAFPQDGIVACPGNAERMEEALRLGADGVGAIPHGERTREDGVESLEICFELAKKYSAFVHVFCDETDDEQSRFLECTAALAIKHELYGKVTASHCSATAYYNESYFQKLLGLVKASRIHIIACPLINSSMQGRFDAYPRGRGIARIRDMSRAGIPVAIAHDDMLTPFYPYGDGNLLQAVHMAAHLEHMTGRDDAALLLDMVTKHGAGVLGLEDHYGIDPGHPANLVVLPVQQAADAIRLRPKPLYVIRQGRVIAHTPPMETEFSFPPSYLQVY
ncbi:amidohydrolase family protein [Paenibacillus urinalis]|uniref:Amidohydrolase family protein n=1 Tax=Paenibacillus urinalis TaxID=521520 RepID=A0ABY7X7B1_9BACL|nr:amidohydrolase family protein [Paenibacillus urinalis]WDH97759.1 amidohydrolase family protein [Paenibacillus urinalis]WDI01434.1 amidohydrolase family protein [Paenibacillus urinalis]